MIFYPKRGQVMTVPLRCGRTNGEAPCERCWRRRMNRLRDQVLAEGPENLFWRVTDEDEAGRIVRRLRNVSARYKRFPLDGEQAGIIADQNQRLRGEPLPAERDELDKLMGRLSMTPPGERVSGSRGFGKQCAGKAAKRVSEEKGEAKMIDMPAGRLAKLLEEHGAEWRGGGYGEDRMEFFKLSRKLQTEFLREVERRGLLIKKAMEVPGARPDAEPWDLQKLLAARGLVDVE